MSLFDTLFSRLLPQIKEPDIKFGRYSDSYKSEKQHQSLDNATKLFENGSYLEAIREFLSYLRDEQEDNVHFDEKNGLIKFDLLQGSKRITGTATPQSVQAETILAQATSLPVALMRKLMEINYNLRYCRYALHDDIIYLKFNTGALDGSPQKLYFALKEMAVNADRQDDVLLNEFTTLKAFGHEHIHPMPDQEKTEKFKFFRQWIQNTLLEVRRLDPNIFSRGISYLLLNLAYKIDYLLVPQGTVMESVERIHILYFNDNGQEQVVGKNAKMMAEFEKLLTLPADRFYRQLYRTQTTFGITSFATPAQISDIINELLQDVKEFKRRNQLTLAHGVLEYIIHYCMFHYGMPDNIKSLLHLGTRILNADFFKSLDFPIDYYDSPTDSFDKTALKRYIHQVSKNSKQQFPHFQVSLRNLDYRSPADFVYSLLLEIANNNYKDN
ncbi:MAG: hypothetical protein IPM47_21505 [Sphingobacteriales bacterium]|nr:MAG: hypothetical protein IPM47_21505 [Sphingobacteriales bacterium]